MLKKKQNAKILEENKAHFLFERNYPHNKKGALNIFPFIRSRYIFSQVLLFFPRAKQLPLTASWVKYVNEAAD